MATYTDNGTNTPNGSHKVFTYTFPVLQTEDIKVALNGLVQQTTKYTASLSPAQIEFNSTSIDSSVQESTGAPKTGVQVRVFRETTVGKNSGDEDPKAVFAAGSSIRAADLNANQEQALFAIHELQTQPIKTSDIEPDAITNSKIVDNAIDSEHYVDGSIDRVHLAADIVDGTKIADNSIDSEHYVDGSIDVEHLADNSVDRASIVNDAVNGDKIADDSINSEHYVDASIDEQHIANSAVTSNKIADNAVTTTEILNGAVTTAKLAADAIDGTKLADNAVDSEHYTDGSIDRVHLEADIIDSTKLADNAVNSEHYVDGSIDTQHIADGQITEPKLAVNSVNAGKIVDGTVTTNKIANDAVTIDKIADGAIITNSEQAAHSVDDNHFFTTAAAEARYFNASTGETIKDGQTFPDNDTTIATTAAINDRIIDLVDDVGGFVPIANETSFPTSNPDVNDGAGTIVSVSAASTNLVPSGTTVTIANGRGSGLPVVITGVSATIPSGFGFLVETTTTDHTYAFHRLSPKATEVTTVATNATQVQTVHTNITNINAVANNATNINAVAADQADIGAVAAKATEIGRLGTADAVADMAILGTADVVNDMNVLGFADVVSDMNTLAHADVVADMNMLATSDVVSDMNALATSDNITAMDTCRDNISSITNCSTNISSVNTFGDQYQVASNNPSTDGGGNALAAGDLYFNTSANELKVYNGSAWQGGVTATGNFASTTGNTFTGDNTYNDGVEARFGTGGDLRIEHTGSFSKITNTTGDLNIFAANGGDIGLFDHTGTETLAEFAPNGACKLRFDNTVMFKTQADGCHVHGSNGLQVYGTTGGNSNANISLYPTGSGAYSNLLLYNAAGTVYSGLSAMYGGALYVLSGGNSAITYRAAGTGDHVFETNGVERFRIDDTNIKLPDSQKINFGAGLDLQIYHDGSNSFITDTATGNLNIGGSLVQILNPASTEVLAKFTTDAAAQLYYDNSPKLETTNGGIVVTGTIGSDGIYMGDNERAKFGASNDLQIYHDSGANYVGSLTTSSLYFFTYNVNRWVIDGQGSGKGHLLPFVDSEYDIGSNNTRVRNGYFDTLYGDGSNLTGINTDLVSDTSPQLGGTLDTNGNLITFGDSSGATDDRLKFGVGADLSIFHNATDSYIENKTNDLYILTSGSGDDIIIKSNDDIFIQPQNGEDGIKVIGDGAVELYHNSNKKFETTSTGTTTTGTSQVDNDVKFTSGARHKFIGSGTNELELGTYSSSNTSRDVHLKIEPSGNVLLPNDNAEIRLGASGDLQLFHDGTNSNIYNASGNLRIRAANNLQLETHDGYMHVKCVEDAQVELYYNNSKKLETTSTGFEAYGGQFRFNGVEGGAAQLLVYADEGDDANDKWRLMANTDNTFILGSLADGSWDTCIKAIGDGTVELYYNNIKQFETNTGGITVTDDDSTSWVQMDNTSGTAGYLYGSSSTDFGLLDGQQHWLLKGVKDGKLELRYDNSVKLETKSNGATVYGGLHIEGGTVDHTGDGTLLVRSDNNNDWTIMCDTQTGGAGEYGLKIRTEVSTGYAFAVTNGSGDTIGFLINGPGNIEKVGHIKPSATNTYDLGTSSYRWRNIYTQDLQLSNEAVGDNGIDGTWGNFTIVEGESDLFLKNNRNGKTYKFNLTEVS